jgi:DNA-binding response OmpR family regulator
MKPKILIVDDAIDSWHILRTVLESHQYQPIWAADSIQALNLARVHHPRAILLDLGLPGGDGFLVLERLKANRLLAGIPVVVITVRDPEEAEARALSLGARAYCQKPIKADTLMALLAGVLGNAEKRERDGRP